MFLFRRKIFRIELAQRTLVLGERTLLMGVLNVTPDSFSDGGKYFSVNAAVKQALDMEGAGASIVDIGGESTRPGSQGITAEQELRRVLPVLERLRGKLKIPISIDTQKAAVAEAAVRAGAAMINDVSALRMDPQIAGVARRFKLPLILMHMRGEPRTMQKQPFARDVMQDVRSGLQTAVRRARKAGVSRAQIILDPGIGFGKSYAQNCEILARLPELSRMGYPLLVGASRKTFIGAILGSAKNPLPPSKRLWGTAATIVASILGGAHIVRVHDVAEMAQVARIADAVASARK
jgi:dihydropteroate synthase